MSICHSASWPHCLVHTAHDLTRLRQGNPWTLPGWKAVGAQFPLLPHVLQWCEAEARAAAWIQNQGPYRGSKPSGQNLVTSLGPSTKPRLKLELSMGFFNQHEPVHFFSKVILLPYISQRLE